MDIRNLLFLTLTTKLAFIESRLQAILGGKCVDADIDMGEALTDLVHTFVSVAGANRGAFILKFESKKSVFQDRTYVRFPC